MARYAEWWDTTITIFNRYQDPQTQAVKWFRTVLQNCFWKNLQNEVILGEVKIATGNSILCRIPENPKFIIKPEWEKKPNDEMAGYFTLGQGDIVIAGRVDFEIDEYVKGKRSTDLISKYKAYGCMEIQTIAINIGPGRVWPHYRVEGK